MAAEHNIMLYGMEHSHYFKGIHIQIPLIMNPSRTMMPSSSGEASTLSSALAEMSRDGRSPMDCCRILQVSMHQLQTGYWTVSVVNL